MLDFVKLDQLAQDLMKNRKAHLDREIGSVYYHGRRVAALALELRRQIVPGDDSMDETLRLAGMFHDVGKGIEPHEAYGATIMRQAVEELVPPEQALRASRMIENHPDRRPQEDVHDVWTRLLQDADLLDHMGTYGLWMDIQYQAHHHLCVDDHLEYLNGHVEEYFAYHRAQLNFPLSIEEYDRRGELVLDYWKRLQVEAEGRLLVAGQEV